MSDERVRNTQDTQPDKAFQPVKCKSELSEGLQSEAQAMVCNALYLMQQIEQAKQLIQSLNDQQKALERQIGGLEEINERDKSTLNFLQTHPLMQSDFMSTVQSEQGRGQGVDHITDVLFRLEVQYRLDYIKQHDGASRDDVNANNPVFKLLLARKQNFESKSYEGLTQEEFDLIKEAAQLAVKSLPAQIESRNAEIQLTKAELSRLLGVLENARTSLETRLAQYQDVVTRLNQFEKEHIYPTEIELTKKQRYIRVVLARMKLYDRNRSHYQMNWPTYASQFKIYDRKVIMTDPISRGTRALIFHLQYFDGNSDVQTALTEIAESPTEEKVLLSELGEILYECDPLGLLFLRPVARGTELSENSKDQLGRVFLYDLNNDDPRKGLFASIDELGQLEHVYA